MTRTVLTIIGIAALTLPAMSQDQPSVHPIDASAGPQVEIPEGAYEITLPNLGTVAAAPPAPPSYNVIGLVPDRRTRAIIRAYELGDQLRGQRARTRLRVKLTQGNAVVDVDTSALADVQSGDKLVELPSDVFEFNPAPDNNADARLRPEGRLLQGPTNIHGIGQLIRNRRTTGSTCVLVVTHTETTATPAALDLSADQEASQTLSAEAVDGPQPGFPSAVELREAASAGYSLSNASPNPVTASTTISFQLPRSGRTALTIFDNAGRVVATLLDEHLDAGAHTRTFDAANLPAGHYLFRLSSGGFVGTKTMTVVR